MRPSPPSANADAVAAAPTSLAAHRGALAEGIEALEAGKMRRARSVFQAEAARGDAAAKGYLGILTWLGKGGLKPDARAAVDLFAAAAEAGLVSAQVNYALALASGIGVAQDVSAALVWLGHAARQGSPAGKHHLAALTAPEDPVRARALWKEAAEAGYPPAMAAYGRAVADGVGGPADFVDGLAWLYAAGAAGGDEEAASAAKFLASRMLARDISTGHRRGRALAKRFAHAVDSTHHHWLLASGGAAPAHLPAARD